MKKIILKNGLIAGAIVSALMMTSMALYKSGCGSAGSMIIGYASMLISFIFIFVGVKNFRDKQNGGTLTFLTGLKIGLGIALIASTIYVIAWAIDYHFFLPDFMIKYSSSVIKELKAHGASQAMIDSKTAEMAHYSELYKNPVYFALFTYAEMLPVGILMSVISALVFKRKQRPAAGN